MCYLNPCNCEDDLTNDQKTDDIEYESIRCNACWSNPCLCHSLDKILSESNNDDDYSEILLSDDEKDVIIIHDD